MWPWEQKEKDCDAYCSSVKQTVAVNSQACGLEPSELKGIKGPHHSQAQMGIFTEGQHVSEHSCSLGKYLSTFTM